MFSSLQQYSSSLQQYFSFVGDPADVTVPNFWLNDNFYTTLNSTATRVIFTTVFVSLNVFIGLLGVSLLKRRNQLQLLKGKDQDVPLNRLSPWLSATDALMYTWETRRLPGGIFGVFMLLTGIFSTVNQFFVTSFITPATGFYGSCTFTKGLVLQPPFAGGNFDGSLIIAESQWPAAGIAISAQLAAKQHGDPPGIYVKANSDPNFTAAKDNAADYLGSWICEGATKSPMTFPPNTSRQEIGDALVNNGSMYTGWHNTSQPLGNGLLLWGASHANITGQTWGVQASVGPDVAADQPIVMYNINCTMSAPAVEWVIANMSGSDSLERWSDATYGRLVLGSDAHLPGYPDTYASHLTILLNAMVMATASKDNATSVVTSESKSYYNGTDTYRCAAPRTIIPFQIWLMLGFLLLLFLSFLIACLILLLLIRCRSQRAIVSDIPSDIPGWQLATLRDRFPRKEPAIEATTMNQYVYVWCRDHKRLQFKEKTDSRVIHSSQVDG